MRAVRLWLGILLFGVGIAWVSANQAIPTSGTTLFEGARLIVGDGRAPIENSAFLVEKGKITRVAMPALIDIHNHLGWTKINKVYQRGTAIDRAALSKTLSAEAH